MKQNFRLAFRGLLRNKRRSMLSALALGLGVALLLFMAAFVEGEMRASLELSVSLESGHMQVRTEDYSMAKANLAWEDLVEEPDLVASQIAAMPQVAAASPRLYASGILLTGDESLGARIIGVDPESPTTAVYREQPLVGEWLAADDREGVLIGEAMSRKRGLGVGDEINLLINTSNGTVDEQRFTIRGVYDTDTPSYDQANILMPLAKAQAITAAGDHASLIWVELVDMFQVDEVASALTSDRYVAETWQEMNELQITMEDMANAMMFVFYLIVLGITATVVVNAMVMAVFERTREIGILAAIGMRARRIRVLFLTESFMLAVGGVLVGLILGGIGVWYASTYGIYFGDLTADMGLQGFMLGDRIYAYLTLEDAVMLVLTAFGVTVLASLYPAALAARMEPVQALHGGEA